MNNTAILNPVMNIQKVLPLFPIITKEIRTYNGDGETYMDKAKKTDIAQYKYDNNVVMVERYFTNNVRINDILKQYIVERKKNALHNLDERCYNSHSNTTVVDFSERRNK